MKTGDLVTIPYPNLGSIPADEIGLIIRVEKRIKTSGSSKTVYCVYINGKIYKALYPWMTLL